MRTRIAIACVASSLLLAACIIGPKQDDPLESPGSADAGGLVADAPESPPDFGFSADTSTVTDAVSVPGDTSSPADTAGPFDPCRATDAGPDADVGAGADAGDAKNDGGVDAASCVEAGPPDAVTGG